MRHTYPTISPILPALAAILAVFTLAGCQKKARAPYEWEFRSGKTCFVRTDGTAVAPRKAPAQVHRATVAANRIHGRPYRWGGGHRKVEDSGYDCSGAVSYALIHAGLLESPTTSTALKTFGKPGHGKYISIYAKSGHTFMTVCGLRFDTGYGRGAKGPRWHTTPRPTKGYVVRHPPGL
ncbi:MAG: NlpC/P60 family protein [Verrucomicrobiota bacterium]